MLMQAVLSCDERAMEAEESFITTIKVTTSPPYEQFKLHNFHLLVLWTEMRWGIALPGSCTTTASNNYTRSALYD